MVTCEACGEHVSVPMPAKGPMESMEPLTWEHNPNCALVLDSIADEDGPWNAPVTKRQAKVAVDLRPLERRIRRHPDKWPS
jgi:hypothetical protein